MSAATETRPTVKRAAPSRIGPFQILGRIGAEGGAGVVELSVVGAEGTPLAGTRAIAQCFSAPTDEAARDRLRAMLDGLTGLAHPTISSPLHAGLSGNIAYVVNAEQPPSSEERRPPMAPAEAARCLDALGKGLDTAHAAGFSHGGLSRQTVVAVETGHLISGWSLFGRGPAEDQRGLALLAVDWLAGLPFSDIPASDKHASSRVARLRQHLDGLSEQVVLVLARASESVAADRFPSIAEFTAAFQQAVTRSGEDLVHGAFEAISRRSPELAGFMAASAERYDPGAPGLDLLKMQLGGAGAAATPAMPSLGAPGTVAPAAPSVMAGLDPALTAGIPPEMLAMIAPPIPTIQRPKSNPWLVMIVGGAGLTLLLLIAAAIMLFAGSS